MTYSFGEIIGLCRIVCHGGDFLLAHILTSGDIEDSNLPLESLLIDLLLGLVVFFKETLQGSFRTVDMSDIGLGRSGLGQIL